MKKIFIDGSAGTTGLRIRERLAGRKDLELITLPEELRKDASARLDAITAADVAFLCLPDAAAREAVALIGDASTVVIDTSTAHRTVAGWTYGFPELAGQREKVRSSKRIANPGCHASGFISLVAPLVHAGALKKDARLSCFSLTGYSGGGKNMIAAYEAQDPDPLFAAPRQYGIAQNHKHLPEMRLICGLEREPVFCPIVDDFYSGMEVTVPLFAEDLSLPAASLPELYREYYASGLVRYSDENENGFLSAQAMSGRDDMLISVFGDGEKILLISRFDNLGKGASGTAIQNMNLVLGVDETTGLVIGG